MKVSNALSRLFRRLLLGASVPYEGTVCYAAQDTFAPPPSDVYLQYWENGLRLRLDLNEEETSVGSGKNVGCTLDKVGVAEKLVTFSKNGNRWYVTDVAPTGDTYLDGKPLEKNLPALLSPGSVIKRNEIEITFQQRGKSAPSDSGQSAAAHKNNAG